jgi:hypothetical protein
LRRIHTPSHLHAEPSAGFPFELYKRRNVYTSIAGGPQRKTGTLRWLKIYFRSIAQRNDHMNLLIGVLITFLVVILVLYLVNMLPIDGRAKQIVRIIVIIIGVLSLLRYLGVAAWP